MLPRVAASVLVLCLLPTSAIAQTLRAAAENEAKKLAAQTTTTAKNPYKTPAIALMAGGAALLVLGLVQDRGAEVNSDPFGTNVSVRETGGSKTALTVLGITAAAAGAGLWFWGENKKKARPAISVYPRRVQLSFRF